MLVHRAAVAAAPGVVPLLAVALLCLGLVLAANLYNAVAVVRSLFASRRADGKRVPAHHPRISVLVPAYQEEKTLPRCIESITAMDYPRDKLEILLITEPNDPITGGIAEELTTAGPPGLAVKHIVVAETNEPPGKPRALNQGLEHATGEVVGVIDAEDIVDPSLCAAAAYELGEGGFDAIQGVLDMANDFDGWMNLQFRAEYGYWFRLYLPGAHRAGYPIPFGGTTNFLTRSALDRLGGWDAHNVTEDFDLGLRAYAAGMRVGTIGCVTREESPTTFGAWLRQRTRWQRGKLQTMKKLIRMRPDGVRRATHLLLTCLVPHTPVLNLCSLVLTLYVLRLGGSFPLAYWCLAYAGLASTVWLCFVHGYGYVVATRSEDVPRRRLKALTCAVTVPGYWLAQWVAELRAIRQEVIEQTVFWEKTEHHLRHESAWGIYRRLGLVGSLRRAGYSLRERCAIRGASGVTHRVDLHGTMDGHSLIVQGYGSGEPVGFEHMLRLSGVARDVGAHAAVLVVPSLSPNARGWARQLDIRVIESNNPVHPIAAPGPDWLPEGSAEVDAPPPPPPPRPKGRAMPEPGFAVRLLGATVVLAAIAAGTWALRVQGGGVGPGNGGRERRAAAVARVAQALPGHFAFGVMNAPGDVEWLNDMRSRNGTAWDFRYQYLSGGVNTGRGWETWASPPGRFAATYLTESGSNGYIPVFVYYELLQSRGRCRRCTEPRRDLSNLQDPRVMSAYYGNWKLLMQRVGTYGNPAVVIVEPDLWGYVEQAADFHGNSADAVAASVANSGSDETTGLPDTAQGFAWALLQIRDRYAPNALLALHASPWATGVDISSSPSPALDPVGIGAREAEFLQSAGLAGTPRGISPFDLVSSDVANRDSGQSGTWWDTRNVRYPNFTRYLDFIASISTATSRPILMWQVPAGNQYFRTEDDSPGHTQDNRPQYILGHVPAFAAAGVVGVLFGPGNAGTTVGDARRDGVTNAAAIRSFQCAFCNTHISTYADDDGGYLRIFVGRYYRSGPYELNGTCERRISFGGTRASSGSAAPGDTLLFTTWLRASCATTGLVDFQVYDASGHRVWQGWQANLLLTGRTQAVHVAWRVPDRLTPGPYTLKVGVFNAPWTRLYGWNDGALRFLVTDGAAGCRGAPRITFGKASASRTTAEPGRSVTFTARLRSSCPVVGLVDFQLYDRRGHRVWQDWGEDRILTGHPRAFRAVWRVPGGLPPGRYRLTVGVFSPTWDQVYGWNERAARITVPS